MVGALRCLRCIPELSRRLPCQVSLSGWSYPPLNGNSVWIRLTFTTCPWRMELEPRATSDENGKHPNSGWRLVPRGYTVTGFEDERGASATTAVLRGFDRAVPRGSRTRTASRSRTTARRWPCAYVRVRFLDMRGQRVSGCPLSASSSLPSKSVQDPSSRVRAPGAPRLEEGLRAGGGRGVASSLQASSLHTHIVSAFTSGFCVGRVRGHGRCSDVD